MTGRIDQPDSVDTVDQRSAKSRHALSNSAGARKGKMDRAILFRDPTLLSCQTLTECRFFFFMKAKNGGEERGKDDGRV